MNHLARDGRLCALAAAAAAHALGDAHGAAKPRHLPRSFLRRLSLCRVRLRGTARLGQAGHVLRVKGGPE